MLDITCYYHQEVLSRVSSDQEVWQLSVQGLTVFLMSSPPVLVSEARLSAYSETWSAALAHQLASQCRQHQVSVINSVWRCHDICSDSLSSTATLSTLWGLWLFDVRLKLLDRELSIRSSPTPKAYSTSTLSSDSGSWLAEKNHQTSFC